ncbi:MAG: DUF4350 domain-containing protein, partial [Bdellovibrionota bacterium]
MRQDKTVLILAGFLTLVVMLWFVAQMGSSREKGRVARTDSNTPTGIKIFADLKENLQPSSATQWRRPFLKVEDLERFDALFIVAPKISLSAREEGFILDWVKAGGKLILSAENDEGVARISGFLGKAGISPLIDETPGFKNGRAVEYEAKEDSGFVKAGEKYFAYSPVRFQDSLCLKDPGTCWSREGAIESGTVTVFLGFPPFSNAMIDRGDNRKIAARLALGTKRVAFDEYHLLVTEKTTKDLFLDPAFALPLLGMIIGLLLYFLAGGEAETSDVERRRRKKGASSWHDFGRRVLAKTLEREGVLRDGVARQAKFFAALAPK